MKNTSIFKIIAYLIAYLYILLAAMNSGMTENYWGFPFIIYLILDMAFTENKYKLSHIIVLILFSVLNSISYFKEYNNTESYVGSQLIVRKNIYVRSSNNRIDLRLNDPILNKNHILATPYLLKQGTVLHVVSQKTLGAGISTQKYHMLEIDDKGKSFFKRLTKDLGKISNGKVYYSRGSIHPSDKNLLIINRKNGDLLDKIMTTKNKITEFLFFFIIYFPILLILFPTLIIWGLVRENKFKKKTIENSE